MPFAELLPKVQFLNNLPVLLDILAFGGIVSLTLFMLPLINFIIINFASLNIESIYRLPRLVSYAHLTTIFVVMTFNPVWLQPIIGFSLWSALALFSGSTALFNRERRLRLSSPNRRISQ